MKHLLEKIKDTNISGDELNFALEGVLYYAENVDNAEYFDKIGGWDVIAPCFKHKDSTIRLFAAWIFSTLIQNNIQLQTRAIEKGVLHTVMALIILETDLSVVVKQLGLVSSIISNQAHGQKLFVHELQGIQLISKLIASPNQQVQFKAIWLLRSVMEHDNKCKDIARLYNIGASLESIITSHQAEQRVREQAISTLITFVTNNPENTIQTVHLIPLIAGRISELSKDENLADEVQLLHNLQSTITADKH